MLTKQQIQSTPRCRLGKVFVPEWAPEGTTPEEAFVYVRNMSCKERREFNERYKDVDGNPLPDAAERMVCDFVCDENGTQIFTAEEIGELSERDHDVVPRVAAEILLHCGLTKRSLEDAEKNSAMTPSSSSATA